MNQQVSLFEEAHARSTDPQTSHDAAKSVDRLTEKQNDVLRLLKEYGPLSDEMLIVEHHIVGLPSQSESGIRTRRSELVAKGLVRDSGKRSLTRMKRETILWEAVDEGNVVMQNELNRDSEKQRKNASHPHHKDA